MLDKLQVKLILFLEKILLGIVMLIPLNCTVDSARRLAFKNYSKDGIVRGKIDWITSALPEMRT